MLKTVFFLALFFSSLVAICQPVRFSENQKWGIQEGGKTLVAPVFDTIFDFDKNRRVCLACFKVKSTSANKFIKVTNTNLICNYLNANSERLVIKTSPRDTCSVFQLGKQTVLHYNDNDSVFRVKVKNKMYLVGKSFQQLSFKPYTHIEWCDDPGFYIVQGLNEVDVPMYGLVTRQEELIIPFHYSGIKLNPSDSLVMVCGTGYGAGTEDYVFDYTGKKLQTFKHHVELATKEYIVFKIFEPQERFVTYHIETKEEEALNADEIKFFKANTIRIRMGTNWWLYNLKTKQKTEFNN